MKRKIYAKIVAGQWFQPFQRLKLTWETIIIPLGINGLISIYFAIVNDCKNFVISLKQVLHGAF